MQIVEIFLRSFGLMLAILLITIGYLVAPILFMNVHQTQAGSLVGDLLSAANKGILLSILLLFLVQISRLFRFSKDWLLIVSVTIVTGFEFWLLPLMDSIKASYPQGLTQGSEDWSSFAMWHGVYQLLYLTLIFALLAWSLLNLKVMVLNAKK